jgi:TRAP-type C4-dicarboxylate transport system permease small subunit
LERIAATDAPLPPLLAGWRRSLAVIGRAEMALAVAALIVVVVLSAAQAALRYLFGTSLWWAQEIAETVILITYFLGVSHVFKARQYIVIEFLSSRFPVRVQVCLYLFAQIAALTFAVATVVLVIEFTPRALGMQTPVLRLPGVLPFIPIAVGSAMIAWTSLYYLAFTLWALTRGGISGSLAATEERAIAIRAEHTLDW